MTPDEQTIIDLTRENQSLRAQLATAKEFKAYVDREMNRAEMPSGFEDGNTWDDFDTSERVSILVDSYLQLDSLVNQGSK